MSGRLVAEGVSDPAGWRWSLAAVAAFIGLCAILVVVNAAAFRYARPAGDLDSPLAHGDRT